MDTPKIYNRYQPRFWYPDNFEHKMIAVYDDWESRLMYIDDKAFGRTLTSLTKVRVTR